MTATESPERHRRDPSGAGRLRLDGVGKAYKHYARRSGRLAEWLGLGMRHTATWVLRDVTFAIEPGEAVAIVGENGAGKSTLLKIIAGTTRATTGSVGVDGRVAALLELGLGFHADFTGRENAVMAGLVMGMRNEEVVELMPAIEDFAEIGEAIDQPVRTYSTGMQVRLAFSVATARRPDVLIVDEALSVGDAYFQHKSFDRIRRFREDGTTLLFVSHSPAAVKTLCDRALLLDHGVLVRDDAADAVLDYYNALVAAHHADYAITQSRASSGAITTRSGSAHAVVDGVELRREGAAVTYLASGDAAALRVRVSVHEDVPELTVGVLIRDRLGNDVFGTNTFHHGVSRADAAAGERLEVEFAFASLMLGVGSYSVSVALHAADRHTASNFDWWDRALVFQVVRGAMPESVGVCALPVSVEWLAPGDSRDRDGTSVSVALAGSPGLSRDVHGDTPR